MRIAICDDERLYSEAVIENCKRILGQEDVIYDYYTNGEELLGSDMQYDFLFLDIEMTGMDGIHVKDILEREKSRVKIIFLTSHEERMVEAFGANVIGFLQKPIRETAFAQIVKKMKLFVNRKTVEWEENGKRYVVYADSVRYIEAEDKYTYLVTEDEKYLIRRTMKEWEEVLPHTDFCRVNRSYIINLALFDKNQDEVILEEDKRIRLSRKNKGAILEQYRSYLRSKLDEV
ncbi:MAG: response regulator transcription factor [Lachnospiraceae bacterium]|nr:response regulator transcription factor [Lachnospiraceae bacterium]